MESLIEIGKANTFPLVLEQVVTWWATVKSPHSSGDRAMLRRSRSPDEVALQAAYYTLLESVLELDDTDMIRKLAPYRLPLIAGVLAHVKEDNSKCPIAKAMGMKKKGSDRPVISDLRFSRILRTEDSAELYITMIRVIKMLDYKVDVRDVITSLFFWNEQTRKRWASQYYLQKDMY